MNSQEVVDFIHERMQKNVELKTICEEVNHKLLFDLVASIFLFCVYRFSKLALPRTLTVTARDVII